LIDCRNCGSANDAGRKFCGECGTRLASACPNCGTVNGPTSRFCGECGTPLPGANAGAGGTAAIQRAAGPAGTTGASFVGASAAGATAPGALGSARPANAPVAERRRLHLSQLDETVGRHRDGPHARSLEPDRVVDTPRRA